LHGGIDIRAQTPIPVLLTDNTGTAILDDNANQPEGKHVHASQLDPNNTELYEAIYMHLSSITMSQWGPYGAGTQVGLSGETGAPGQPHLHYQYRPNPATNPASWNPLHILPYYPSGVSIIEPPDILYTFPNDIYEVDFMTTTPRANLDLNRISIHLWRPYTPGRWYDDNLVIDYDQRIHVDEIWYWGGIPPVNDATVYCFPQPYIEPHEEYQVRYVWQANTNVLHIPGPAEVYFGINLQNVSIWCMNCFGIMFYTCWWGNPNCHSPIMDEANLTATFEDGMVKLMGLVITSMPTLKVSIWKNVDTFDEFTRLTSSPFSFKYGNNNFRFVDSDVISGHT
jgi:hypothetical protein